MSLSREQEQLIVYIDTQVNGILCLGGDERDILVSLADIRDELKKIIDCAVAGENIDIYYHRYDGFYYFMMLLENLAEYISQGHFKT